MPVPGEGTLGRRLAGSPVHAKTGTLFVTPVSALSGYVRDADGRLVTFSILSRGMDKPTAVAIEDAVVRVLSQAHVT
jgi:D-alanyl-D-alanine carboxypeptidase/D-alanyl-D-alanine-endopeptidase (penicillin-binding protein 4)